MDKFLTLFLALGGIVFTLVPFFMLSLIIYGTEHNQLAGIIGAIMLVATSSLMGAFGLFILYGLYTDLRKD